MAVSSVSKNVLGEHMRRVGIDVVSITRDPDSDTMRVQLTVRTTSGRYADELEVFKFVCALGLSIQYKITIEEPLDNVKEGERE